VKIAFRVDASIQIGTGHVMRCLTLADQLRNQGAEVHFICRDLQGHMGEIIGRNGYSLHLLPAPRGDVLDIGKDEPVEPAHASWLGTGWQQDAEETGNVLDGIGGPVNWLIIDHYTLDNRWESTLRTMSERIMVIDDLADRHHECDLLLDQNLYENLEHRYDALVPMSCRKLLGPRYALLRPEFTEAREHLRDRDGTVRRILVFYGGSDPTNETAKALDAISYIGLFVVNIDVIVGMSNPNLELIKTRCGELANVTFHCQVDNIAELMAEADLAIAPDGGPNLQ